ncbi:hypothetical protein [Vibrio neonatus]|nr:hypothetical protein [Vibrio neonatus]
MTFNHFTEVDISEKQADHKYMICNNTADVVGASIQYTQQET